MLCRHVSLASALSVCLRHKKDSAASGVSSICWRQWASTKPNPGEEKRPVRTKQRHASTSNTEDWVKDPQPKRKRGRPRKTPPADEQELHGQRTDESGAELENSNGSSKTRPRRGRRSRSNSTDLPPRLTSSASPHHHDLSSFLAHAARAKLNPNSNVYRGTHYEYTCIDVLTSKNYNLELHRTGRANDLGIDLVGWWRVPDWPTPAAERREKEGKRDENDSADKETERNSKRKPKVFRNLKVIAQCKALAPTPSMIRELEGAYVGAPSGWNSSSNVLAFLIASGPATKGTLAALQRSRWPMGMLQITRAGEVKQFVWNAVAADSGLAGMSVVVRYSPKKNETGEGESGVAENVRLSWMGRVWKA